ncbi:MAG: hypothetical protein ABIP63_07950 [Thermoanaerobaculia bacterium]
MIGSVLVLIAALAVYTGVRYRNPTLADGIRSRKAPRAMTHGGPPGEPEPGSSLVFPGEGGDNAPAAQPPAAGRARAQITNDAAGISATVRLWARRGMVTNVTPDDAMIFVNDLAIGEARQFNTGDEIYDFPAPGSYHVRIVAPGYREQQFVVTASETASAEIARLDVKLVRAQ